MTRSAKRISVNLCAVFRTRSQKGERGKGMMGMMTLASFSPQTPHTHTPQTLPNKKPLSIVDRSGRDR
jgi:hypothetical protein